MQSNKRILGIDPGYGRLGIAIIEQRVGDDIVLFSQCVETSSVLSFPERLAQTTRALEKVIKKWGPEICALEKLFFQKNQKTAMRVAETRGALIAEITKHKLALLELSPQEIKIALTGHGGAKKADVAHMINLTVNLPSAPKHDDEYDAIACGITASRHARSSLRLDR